MRAAGINRARFAKEASLPAQRPEDSTMPPTIKANAAACYACGSSPRKADDISAANSGVRLLKKAAMFGPARCTPTPQQRKATIAGPTATYSSAAAKPQLQCIAGDVPVHSPAANSPDHSTPKLICASRKAAQLRRISGGSSGCASSQL